jgi:site-specific DNA-adenine methylase
VAGGERLQLPQLAALWREHAYPTFVEPFCGALAVTLRCSRIGRS